MLFPLQSLSQVVTASLHILLCALLLIYNHLLKKSKTIDEQTCEHIFRQEKEVLDATVHHLGKPKDELLSHGLNVTSVINRSSM